MASEAYQGHKGLAFDAYPHPALADPIAFPTRLVPRHEETAPAPTGRAITDLSSAARKEYPLTRGLLDYFPDALAEVARHSFIGNLKHNKGEDMHHARGKSMDHADCIARHLIERGSFETIVIDGVEYKVRHSIALAWRALALAQEELERDLGLPLPRGAR
jgi:hypothetical protein